MMDTNNEENDYIEKIEAKIEELSKELIQWKAKQQPANMTNEQIEKMFLRLEKDIEKKVDKQVKQKLENIITEMNKQFEESPDRIIKSLQAYYVSKSETNEIDYDNDQHVYNDATQQQQQHDDDNADNVNENAPKRKKIKSDQVSDGNQKVETKAEYEQSEFWRDYIENINIGGLKMFRCTKCNKTLGARHGLKEHVKSHHLGIVYNCSHCDYGARSKSGLIRHVQHKHPEVKFACSRCEYTTNLASSLAYHLSMFHCDASQVETANIDGQGDHADDGSETQAVATKQTPRKIEKIFGIDGRSVFKCPQCDHVSVTRKVMQQHLKDKHLNPAFNCAHCGHINQSKASFRCHLKVHHPEVKFPCSKCSYTAILATDLVWHMAQIHNRIQPVDDNDRAGGGSQT